MLTKEEIENFEAVYDKVLTRIDTILRIASDSWEKIFGQSYNRYSCSSAKYIEFEGCFIVFQNYDYDPNDIYQIESKLLTLTDDEIRTHFENEFNQRLEKQQKQELAAQEQSKIYDLIQLQKIKEKYPKEFMEIAAHVR